MVTKFPKHIFLTSLAITVIVFVAGLMLGYNLDNFRTSEILGGLKVNELDTESYLVEQAFWDNFGGDDCTFAQPRLASISTQLGELGQYLNTYEKKSLFEENEFDYLARRYFLLEVKAYTLEMNLRAQCNLSNTVILYFYGNDDPGSERQGFVLDKLVAKAEGDVNVYSINLDYEGDEALETVNLYYNVTKTPTIIINGEEKREGFTSYNEMLDIIGLTF